LEFAKAIVAELGGGIAAVALVAMGAVIAALWKKNVSQEVRIDGLQDARLADVREFSKEIREIADGSTASINGLTRVLEDRREDRRNV